MSKKAPIGLYPIELHREERFKEVCAAMRRYFESGLPINVQWVEEYNELVVKINFKD